MKLDIPCLALLASLAGAGAFAPSTIVSPVIIGHRSALQPRHAAFGVPHGPQVQTSFRSSSCGAGVSALKSSNGSMKVWVQVITGPDDDDGNYDMSLSETSVDVKVGTDIANLCKAVKKKLPEDFDGISLVRLQVYKSIDSNSKPEGTALGPRDEIPTNADPLYVVAPPRPVQVQPAAQPAPVVQLPVGPIALDNIPSHLVRPDWKKKAPKLNMRRQIGSNPRPFDREPLAQDELLSDLADFVLSPKIPGNRMEYGVIVAMSGWGKTVALDMIAKLALACYSYSKNNKRKNKNLSNKQTMIERHTQKMNNVKRNSLAKCLPIAISLNFGTPYHPANEPDADKALAIRFAYNYMAAPGVSFVDWKLFFENYIIRLEPTLSELTDAAKNAGWDKLLLLVDEPDFAKNAAEILRAVKTAALTSPISQDMRVVFTALTPKWIRAAGDGTTSFCTTTSNHPVRVLRTNGIPINLVKKKVKNIVGTISTHAEMDANYLVALASGRWRTLKEYMDLVKGGLYHSASELVAEIQYVGEIPGKAPLVLGVLAHALLDTKLKWSELLPSGDSVWRAVEKGIIRASSVLGVADYNLVSQIALDILGIKWA